MASDYPDFMRHSNWDAQQHEDAVAAQAEYERKAEQEREFAERIIRMVANLLWMGSIVLLFVLLWVWLW